MVILHRQDYISKANNLLSQNTYKTIQWDPINTIKNKLITILKRVKSQTGLSNHTYKAMYPMGCVPPSSMASPRSTSQIPHLGLLYLAVDLLPMGWPRNLLKSLNP